MKRVGVIDPGGVANLYGWDWVGMAPAWDQNPIWHRPSGQARVQNNW